MWYHNEAMSQPIQSLDEHDQTTVVSPLLSLDTDRILNLKTQDNQIFQVSQKTCRHSNLIQTMAEGDKDADEIPLLSVKSEVLKKILVYLEHYKDTDEIKAIDKPLKSNKMTEAVGEWAAEYIDVPQEMMFELILAANYMELKPLLDLACAKVASMVHGKNPEQIRTLFNIVNDFTPEEEAQLIEENKWAQDLE